MSSIYIMSQLIAINSCAKWYQKRHKSHASPIEEIQRRPSRLMCLVPTGLGYILCETEAVFSFVAGSFNDLSIQGDILIAQRHINCTTLSSCNKTARVGYPDKTAV